MKQKLCAEYLRISDEEAARLVEVAAPAATSDGGTAGLVTDGAEKIILQHFVDVPDEDALDIDTDWESLLRTLTGNPIDGQALGDPLAEAILGADRVCRKPLSAVIRADRVGDVHQTLASIDLAARITDNGSLIDEATATQRYRELVAFYEETKAARSAVLVAIS
ncbi:MULTISPECIES: DUF1877 family protein [Corynebacterium]|uniref:DUF1877 family protein n=1 Tax=Corynebacterium TaxID=1716 RepID=UPI0006699F37|nr:MULTISPECIES: DUF1877 family protein [Corynebacterium]KAA9222316.1 DUF1877 family protein [Corynebacterium amycolatum]MBC6822645.1 DUF1877 domain-containing protein [Corynebacterium sp. LK33]MCA0442570.1 YfbM family protein [Corynebacterium amycolatum]MCQ9349696.1 YfbM family protein [Corynebacterium sp. 5QC2CO]MDK6442139.1 DUF1877 family protein [Corynebacterium amycolatum]